MAATIRPARVPDEIPVVRELLEEFAEGLGFDLGFQNFERELEELPGRYARPRGEILLAIDDEPLGCVALRPDQGEYCELKRLYVRPQARGTGLGRRLVAAILESARERGYGAARFDTIDSMTAGLKLYEEFRFERTEAYYDNPLPGALYFELRLQS